MDADTEAVTNPGDKLPDSSRRARIADAALAVLGREGARALTHRRVDQEAQLPESSTAYYCKRRIDLLALALRRYAEVEHGDLVLYARAFDGAMTEDEIARTAARQIGRWLEAHGRQRLTARFELFLAASREPELRPVIEGNRRMFQRTIEAALRTAAAPAPATTARAIMALTEGFLLDALRSGTAIMKPREVERIVLAVIRQG